MRVVQISAPLTLGVNGMVKVAMIVRWVHQRGASAVTLLPTWMPPDESEPGWIRWGEIGIKDLANTGLGDASVLEGLFAQERPAVADLLDGSSSTDRSRLTEVFSLFIARLEQLGAGQGGPKEPQQVRRDEELGQLYIQLVGPGGIADLVEARLGR